MKSLRLPSLGLFIFTIQCAGAAGLPVKSCDTATLGIKGGNYTLSDGGNLGSKLKYQCPEGKYPYPVLARTCTKTGKWTIMKYNERTVEAALCKDVLCPKPRDFEHGSYEPRKGTYAVGNSLTFECYTGYNLRGPANRTCLANGKWTGVTTICDDGTSLCPHPGQPIGSNKYGNQYNIEDRVRYDCEKGLSMFGSSERVCLEEGVWSGTEPSCRQPYTFDTADEVASAFISSLHAAIEVADPDKVAEGTSTRRIQIKSGDFMIIYILLDASQSVGKDNFDKAKESVISLIEKISTYDITPKYVVITYATEANVLVDLESEDATRADAVIDQLRDFNYDSHLEKSGTNTHAAIKVVYDMMNLHQRRNDQHFMNIRHVIVLMTDGKANMGGDASITMLKIREFLNIGRDFENPREDYLDVYVFGLGDEVSDEEINTLASKKDREKHVFKVKDITDLQLTFNEMIDESSAMSMCGMSRDYSSDRVLENNEKVEMSPWLASIIITRNNGVERCKGSVLSPRFILTAAHCFTIDDPAHKISVEVDFPNIQKLKVKSLASHPNYNINGKRPKFAEFYDYDIALVETETKIEFSPTVRPICIPCTEGTTNALRKPHPQTTCQNHETELLQGELIEAMFVSEKEDMPERYSVKVKDGNKKPVCNQDALKAKGRSGDKEFFIYENVTDVNEVVTERFMCSGGTDPNVDPYTCKGDSGGPLIIPKRHRYIQVGVISWGVDNLCKGMERKQRTKSTSRDFHLNLFKVMPWLKERLKDEGLNFLE